MFAMFGDNISEDNMITNIISIVGNPATYALLKKNNKFNLFSRERDSRIANVC